MSPQPSEHRALKRFPGTLGPLQVTPAAAGTSFWVKVRDFTVAGMGLVADHALTQGTSLLIEAGPFGKTPGPLAAEVCHATQLPCGEWLLGCRLSRNLTLQDLNVLG